MPRIERRFLGTDAAVPVYESRRGTLTGTRTLSGLAAVFNQETELMPRVHERIAPGAFSAVLRDPATRLLINHDSNLVLARVGAGSLSLRENAEGLHFTAKVGAGTVGDSALDMISDARINQMSFGFVVGREPFEQRSGGGVTRIIEKIEKLVDISAVTYPAYSETTVSIANDARSGCVPDELQPERVSAGDLTADQLALLRAPSRLPGYVQPRSFHLAPNSIRRDRSPGPVCVT